MKRFLFMVVVCALASTPALASPTLAAGGAALQGVLDGITSAPVGGSSSVNVNTDMLGDAGDSYWNISATGGSNWPDSPAPIASACIVAASMCRSSQAQTRPVRSRRKRLCQFSPTEASS